MVYDFRIHLKDQRSNKTDVINFTSSADNYLTAWKLAVEDAWAELNQHDTYWYISKIESLV